VVNAEKPSWPPSVLESSALKSDSLFVATETFIDPGSDGLAAIFGLCVWRSELEIIDRLAHCRNVLQGFVA
jgi:hypothetical protein